jgi:hypothetical protein
MTQDWHNDDIIEQFTLLSPEIKFLGINDPHNHLGKALLLKFFQQNYRFPEGLTEIPDQAIEYIAQQLDLPPHVIKQYEWGGTRMREHRTDIRDLMGFHPATLVDQEALRAWLLSDVLPHEFRPDHMEQLVYQRLRREHIEPPSQKQVTRLITSALSRYEAAFFAQTYGRLSPEVRTKLRQLIYPVADTYVEVETNEDDNNPIHHYLLHDLKAGAGAPKVGNITFH